MGKRKRRTTTTRRKARPGSIADRTRRGIEQTFNPPADPVTKFARKLLGINGAKKKRARKKR